MRVRLVGVNTVRKRRPDGSQAVYYYHRATGTRLEGTPGTAQFAASFAEAGRKAAQVRSKGTVDWLIREYQNSPKWRDGGKGKKKLAEKTKRELRMNLKACSEEFGTMPLSALPDRRTRPLMLKWHERLADDHPRAADGKLAALAGVFAYGIDRGYIEQNPLTTFTRAYQSNRADNIWLPEHVAAFEAVASPEIRLALMLGLHTGQRQGDLLVLPWSAYDGAGIHLRQGKTGAVVDMPVTQALKAALDAAPRKAETILVAYTGIPWKTSNLHRAWSLAFKASGITDDLHFHDLRGTAVTMLAEAGCTVPEIASITGHRPAQAQKILTKYLSRTRALAEAAITKLDAHRRNQAANSIANLAVSIPDKES